MDVQPGDKRLNFEYASLLSRLGGAELDTLVNHFRRAFTQWDNNYEAQFWFARYAFESADEETRRLGKEVFMRLRNAFVKHQRRVAIRSSIEDGGERKVFAGTVVRRQETNGFVEVDGRGERLFFHRNAQREETWAKIQRGKRVSFTIGFALSGPRGVQLEPI